MRQARYARRRAFRAARRGYPCGCPGLLFTAAVAFGTILAAVFLGVT
jgi:hypothetical protein